MKDDPQCWRYGVRRPGSRVSCNENRKGTGELDKVKVTGDLGRVTCSGMGKVG